MPPLPRIEWTGPLEWVNRHENVRQRVARLVDLRNPLTANNRSTIEAYNAMTAGIQDLLRRAAEAGVRVRAAGGGWSLSEVATTDGWLLNTQPLDFSFRLGPAVLTERWQARSDELLLAQCGLGVAQLGARLRQDGQSLPTSGASNGQTIAGALSTGTHGAAVDVGAIQDCVRGLHLVPGADRSIWLERASDPVATEEFADVLGARLVRDDELFDAALVGFGSFGFIHGVLLQVEPLFLLEAYRRRVPLGDPLGRAMGELDFGVPELPFPGVPPYHFQVLVNPHDLAQGAYVTVMYKRPFRPDYAPPRAEPDRVGPGDDAPTFVGFLTDGVPGAIAGVANLIIGRTYGEYGPTEGTLGEIFSNTTTRGRVSSTAMGIPLAHARRALAAVLDEHARSGPAAVVVALRYVKGSRATLAFTGFPVTCVLEVDGVQSSRTHAFYERVWARLEDEVVPYTFHWGKQHDLTARRVREMYGSNLDRWLAARRRLLRPEERQMFANDLLRALELDT